MLWVVIGVVVGGCGGDSSVYPFGDRSRVGGDSSDGDKIHTAEESMNSIPGSAWKLAGFETYSRETVSMEALPEGLIYTLAFGRDGRAGGMADCKGYDYAYTLRIEDKDLGISFSDPAPQIMIMCSNEDVDGEFYRGLSSAAWIVSSESTLRIFYPDQSGAINRALYFVPAIDAKAEVSPIEFVPFALILHGSNPYQLEHDDFGNGAKKVRIEGDTLYTPVAYGGGCEEHHFNLYADSDAELVCENNLPCPQTLHLIHSGEPDMCEAYISEERAFNLAPLKEKLAVAGITTGTIQLTILTLDGNGQRVDVEWGVRN
jgi:hypothetical protein